MKKPIILKQVNPKVQQQAITALRLAIRLLEAQQEDRSLAQRKAKPSKKEVASGNADR